MTLPKGIVATLLATCCLLAAASPTAMGATARVGLGSDLSDPRCVGKFGTCQFPQLEFTAAGGETNIVSVTRAATPNPLGPVSLLVRDAGAPLAPGPGCARVDDTGVSCDAPPDVALISISTGDMNDSVTVEAAFSAATDGPATVRGGAGDDRLVGSPGIDLLAGDEGADTLLGGGGDDTFDASDASAAPTADVLDGGPGKDTVSYEERQAAVSVRIGRKR